MRRRDPPSSSSRSHRRNRKVMRLNYRLRRCVFLIQSGESLRTHWNLDQFHLQYQKSSFFQSHSHFDHYFSINMHAGFPSENWFMSFRDGVLVS